MDKLNSHVYLLKPAEGDFVNASQTAKNPSVIVLFAWMDARLPHVQKYSDSLRTLFPRSTIVIVMSDSGFYFSSAASKEKLLAPVVDVLHSEADRSTKTTNGVLLHVISNGGGFQLITLRKLLAKNPITVDSSVGTPPTALVLDSTPGASGLQSAIAAMTPSNPLLHILAIAPVALIYGIYHVINTLSGNPPVFDELRSTLNNEPDLLPGITSASDAKETPRLYVYSKTDKMTLAKNVERHVQEAIGKGFDTSVETYERSAHVTHMRNDPERYWGAIQKLWEKAAEVHVPQ